jgi:hypothetical protein
MRPANYPTGIPSPLVTHVHPYPTRHHGGIWKRPEFGLPYVRTPYSVFRPSQMQGLGLDWDTGTGVFRRPGVDGGGVFNEISGLGAVSPTKMFLGAAALAIAVGVFVAKRKASSG